MKNKILIAIICLLLLFNIGLIISLIYTPKVKLPSNFTKCYQEDNFYIVYDNKTKVMYSVSKDGVLSPLYFSTGNLQVYSK